MQVNNRYAISSIVREGNHGRYSMRETIIFCCCWKFTINRNIKGHKKRKRKEMLKKKEMLVLRKTTMIKVNLKQMMRRRKWKMKKKKDAVVIRLKTSSQQRIITAWRLKRVAQGIIKQIKQTNNYLKDNKTNSLENLYLSLLNGRQTSHKRSDRRVRICLNYIHF